MICRLFICILICLQLVHATVGNSLGFDFENFGRLPAKTKGLRGVVSVAKAKIIALENEDGTTGVINLSKVGLTTVLDPTINQRRLALSHKGKNYIYDITTTTLCACFDFVDNNHEVLATFLPQHLEGNLAKTDLITLNKDGDKFSSKSLPSNLSRAVIRFDMRPIVDEVPENIRKRVLNLMNNEQSDETPNDVNGEASVKYEDKSHTIDDRNSLYAITLTNTGSIRINGYPMLYEWIYREGAERVKVTDVHYIYEDPIVGYQQEALRIFKTNALLRAIRGSKNWKKVKSEICDN